MNKFLDTTECTIAEFFNNNSEIYKVPDYQRPYSWNETQWSELFEDIYNISGKNDSHFIGSIVVITSSHSKKNNVYELVDGQQRICTLIILLSVIRNIYDNNNKPKVVDKINDMITVRDNKGECLGLKLELSDHDNKDFMDLIRKTNINNNKKGGISFFV